MSTGNFWKLASSSQILILYPPVSSEGTTYYIPLSLQTVVIENENENSVT